MIDSIFTSYYTRVNNVAVPDNACLIQVSNTKPAWFSKPMLNVSEIVAPSWSLIERYKGGEITFGEFSEEYKKYLLEDHAKRLLSFREVINRESVKHGFNVAVLMCWEKVNCHRTVLARLSNPDIYVGEL